MANFEHLSADKLISYLKGRSYKYAQVHHTWKPSHKDFTGNNHMSLQQGMYNYHVNTNGWSDIGQHVTLFPDGTFVTGRPFSVTPAGIAGYNTGAFMIEIIGNFDKGHDKFEGDQLNSALKVYNYLVKSNGAKIMFHNEHAAKSCPGTGVDKAKFVKAVKNFDGKTVDVGASTPSKPSTSKQRGTATVTVSSLALRDAPSTDGKLIRTLSKGESYKVWEEKNGWLRIGDSLWASWKQGAYMEWSEVKSTYKKPSKPKPKQKVTGSVVDYMNKKGLDASYSNRKKLASKYGISGYKGTSSQNDTLLSKLQGVSSNEGSTSSSLPTGVLRQGDRGNDVRKLQKALNKANFKVGEPDSIYGTRTKDGVRRFQKVHDPYRVDGIYGERTRSRLQKLI